MKGKLLMLPIILLTFLLMFVGCNNSANQNTNNQEMDYMAYLKDNVEHNQFDNLIKKYGQVEMTSEAFMGNGETYKGKEYHDNERIVTDYDESLIIDENGKLYGYLYGKNGEKEPASILLLYDYEEFKAQYYPSIYGYNEKEKLVKGEVKDGNVCITTTANAIDGKEYIKPYGYDQRDIKAVETYYEFDEKTKEIKKCETTLITNDDKRILLTVLTRNMNAQKYQVDQELREAVFSQDQRTLTVITDAGTPKEKKLTHSAKKGTKIALFVGGVFEAKSYKDPKYTQETTISKNADSTIYVKRVNEGNQPAVRRSGSDAESKADASSGTYQSKDNKRDLWNSKKGYSMTYNPSLFTVEDQDGVDTFKYNTSEKLKAPVYVSVQAHEDMDAQALADGIVLQSGIDGLKVQDTDFGANKIKTKNVYVEKEVNGVKQVQVFYAIPKGKGSLLVEIGSYVGAPQNIDITFEEMLGTFKLK